MIKPVHSGLTPDRLQLFMAGLSGMVPEEVRKAKLLFIKNEISQLRAAKSSQAAFKSMQGCLAFIPVFWPVLALQRSGINTALQMQIEQIQNAISVWKDDLGADAADLQRELDSLSA